VYALARGARACLLIPGQRRYWWTNFAKLVDYLALGVPVVADVPAHSEARQELGKAGQGFFLSGDVEQDATVFLAWLREPATPCVNDYGRRYTAKCQAQAFAHLFDDLLSRGAT
jgi:hypothetical protein